jgi:predicted nucleic acid-binding protein
LNPSRIARVYVVDASVAFFGGAHPDLFAPEVRPLAVAASLFLSRAAYHGAELHVPSVFYSEVTSLVWQNFVTTGVVSLEDAKVLLEDLLSTDWQMHIAVFNDVLDVQHALGRTGGTGDAEYLALAENLECEFITSDERLVEEVHALGLEIPVVLVSAHPWATPGALDDHPPE